MDNLSPSGVALFGTLIEAKNAPFRNHSGHPPAALIFTQNSDNPQMRLARKKGHYGDTWISQDPPNISEKSWTIYRHMGGGYSEP